MAKVDLEEIFFDFFDIVKPYISDSDHIEVVMELLRNLEECGYNLNVLKGHDDVIDEAFEELYPSEEDEYNEYDEDY